MESVPFPCFNAAGARLGSLLCKLVISEHYFFDQNMFNGRSYGAGWMCNQLEIWQVIHFCDSGSGVRGPTLARAFSSDQ